MSSNLDKIYEFVDGAFQNQVGQNRTIEKKIRCAVDKNPIIYTLTKRKLSAEHRIFILFREVPPNIFSAHYLLIA